MRKTIILTLLAMACLAATAQIRIPGTKAEFSLPENEWKYLETKKVDKSTTRYLYSYAKELVVEENGDTVLPNARIYVRKNFTGSVYDYITDRWEEQPYQTLDEFTLDLVGVEAVGYIGAYTNPLDKKDYIFRTLYLVDRGTAMEMRLETTSDTYELFASMFETIIASLTLTR